MFPKFGWRHSSFSWSNHISDLSILPLLLWHTIPMTIHVYPLPLGRTCGLLSIHWWCNHWRTQGTTPQIQRWFDDWIPNSWMVKSCLVIGMNNVFFSMVTCKIQLLDGNIGTLESFIPSTKVADFWRPKSHFVTGVGNCPGGGFWRSLSGTCWRFYH